MIQLSASFKKIIFSSAFNFGFRIFGLGSSFLTTIIISRFFGIETFGNYTLIFALSQLVALFFTLGIPNTLIKIVGNQNFNLFQAKKLLIKGLQGSLFFSFIPVFFFYFSSDFLSNVIFHNAALKNYFLIVTITIPLFIVHEILLYFLIATKNFMKYNFFMFVLPNVLLMLFLYIAYTFGKTEHFTFAAFSLAILLTVMVQIFLIFDINNSNDSIAITTKKLLTSASPLLFSGLFIYLLNYSNVILLGIMTTETQVGIYNIAYKVASSGFLIIVSVSTIITPKMAELFGNDKMTEFKKLTHNATRLTAILTIPIVIGLIFFSKFILSFWGFTVVQGSNTLIIVSIGVLFSALAGNVDQILNMTNNQKILQNITIVSFFINLLLSYILIPIYGIEGAAMSSLFTNILINLMCLYYIKKKLGFYTFI